MELRHLRYFVAIAEEHSFTRAAERVWVAQPALSSQIRRLEAELGIQLFERHARGVDLTAAGVLLLERARAVLAAADVACATGRDLQAGVVGSVRLGIVSGAGWPLLAAMLEAFARDRPDVELAVLESYAGTLMRDLRDGRLDAVLAPAAFGSCDLCRRRLGSDPWLVLAGPGHRLAAGRGPVAADELDGEQFVVTGHRDGAAYDDAVAETLAELGVTPVARRGAAGPALFAPVACGEALALTTSPDAAVRGIVARPLDPVLRVEFALLCCDQTPAPALGELVRAAEAIGRRGRPALRAVA